MDTLSFEHDGSTLEVPIETIKTALSAEKHGIFETGDAGGPRDFVHRGSVAKEVEQAKRDAVVGLVKADDLLDDGAFKTKFFGHLGITLDEAGLPVAKLDAAQQDSLEAQWKSKHMNPLSEKLKTAEEKVTTYETKLADQARATLERDVIAQASKPETRLRDEHLTSLIPGKLGFIGDIVGMLQRDDTGALYFLDADREKQYGTDKMGVIESVLRYLKKRDTQQQYFTEITQKATDLTDNGRPATGNVVSRERYASMTSQEQTAHFQKGGAVID